MNYKKCVYFVEGECENQLINALKIEPRLVIPGKVKVFNVIKNEIPRREVNMIQSGTIVVFVFDTDVKKTDILLKNITYVKKYVSQVKIVLLAQVLNFEDEIARAKDVKEAKEITKSRSVRNFKTDFCKLKTEECRNTLNRHNIDVEVLWSKIPPDCFSFIEQNGKIIKL